jgi:septal ring factor EnvC (AmiA/AmiB activator)
MFPRIWFWTCMFLLTPLAMPAGWSDDAGNRSFNQAVTRPVAQAVEIRQATQKEEERWREEQQKLVARYEKLQSERTRLQAEREALQEGIQAARGRIAAKEKQLIDIDQMQARIEPFLQAAVAELRQMVDEDLPFLPEERRQRVARLEALLKAPDVAISEKYRKVMEAWLVEAEYGNTIEVYQQTIKAAHHEMLANILRLGRISLFYQSLDQSSCGFFDMASMSWQPLPAGDNRAIGAAIAIGTKRKPAELLSLPLGRITAK